VQVEDDRVEVHGFDIDAPVHARLLRRPGTLSSASRGLGVTLGCGIIRGI
jgi:hypothetical protein